MTGHRKARNILHHVLGTTIATELGIAGPTEGADRTHARELKRHNDAIAADMPRRHHQDKRGQRVPAVNENPAAVLRHVVQDHIQVLDLDGRVLPVVADPQGGGRLVAARGGADVMDDGTPYYTVDTPRALVGTSAQIAGFFAERPDFRLILAEDGADMLGIRVSPFIPLPEDRQWKLCDPQVLMVTHMAKILGGLGLGAGIGSLPTIPRGGNIPLPDLADLFDTVRHTVFDGISELAGWTKTAEFLVEFHPHTVHTEKGPQVTQRLASHRWTALAGRQYMDIPLKTVGREVARLIDKLKAKIAS
ncbi:hypothetical protein [Actinokineospora sp.]|uniref:hypothetical protein n=1 Tax=Actinokineospora sp. TaxID=1872133 RepID=UPI004038359F